MSLYNNRLFRAVETEGDSETTRDTIFKYNQRGSLLMATYAGGEIEWGSIIGSVDENGHIDMRYHHRNIEGKLMTGICQSAPEFLESGKIRLHETWQWTCPEMNKDKSKGTSILEEL